jgi:predicted regulator of Ras-like GTPase activity (Roadblock/LC7/MglB family)
MHLDAAQEQALAAHCERLHDEASARLVLVISRSGQVIARAGDAEEIDAVALASLIAGHFSAVGALAVLLGEGEFPAAFQQGERVSLYLASAGAEALLAVVFGTVTSLGLVKHRAEQARGRVADTLARASRSPTLTITDADIDQLFSE